MKKIISVTVVFLMVVGMLFVPTLAKADSVVNITVEEKVITVKLIMLSPRAMQIELDRPIRDDFGLAIDSGKQKSMSQKIESIPGVKAADASENRILFILNDNHNFTRLLGGISLAIMEHFRADSIRFDFGK